LKSKQKSLDLTVETLYVYDIYFEPGTEDKDHSPAMNRKFDVPLQIGQELPAWWSTYTYLITRIIVKDAGDNSIVMCKPSGKVEFGR